MLAGLLTSAITSAFQASESSGETGAGWAMIFGTSQMSPAIRGTIKLTATLNPQVPIPSPAPQVGLSGSTTLSRGPASHMSACGSEGSGGPLKQVAQILLKRVGS